MKWNKTPEPLIGQIRLREAFLLFPKKINGESRWLEVAKWTEVFSYYEKRVGKSAVNKGFEWKAVSWIY